MRRKRMRRVVPRPARTPAWLPFVLVGVSLAPSPGSLALASLVNPPPGAEHEQGSSRVLYPASRRRVVSIADLHGDFVACVKALQLAGVLGEDQRSWIGGSTILVQTGDIVDRGDNSREIYELFFHLQDEAVKVGGEVILLMGNHEHLRLVGDWVRYAGPRESRWSRWGVEKLPKVDLARRSVGRIFSGDFSF